tara:strand:+ start:5224 stop:5838 length:615 start_codon:yes stop_codon:yes gene_type:complete
MIESHTLFVDKMWSAKMPNHEVFKKQVEDIMTIEKNKDIHQFSTEPERECNVKAIRTSWRSHHEYPPIRDITEEIKIFLHEVIQKEKYKINKIMTLEAWANLYRKNDHAIPHHHGKGVIACVYFVSIPKDSKSRFLLYNKNFNAMSEKDENKEVLAVNINEGDIILFPGPMVHSVTNNQSNKERITVAINYECLWHNKRETNDY